MTTPCDLYRGYVSHNLSRIYRSSEREYETYLRYFRKNYLRFLPGDKTTPILDIGCGLGHCLYFFLREGFTNLSGIDLCEEALEQCVARGLLARHQAVRAAAQDYLPSFTNHFGAIVMNDVIEHLLKEEVIPVLTAVKAALRSGGILLVKTANAANPITGSSSRYIDFTHTLAFTEESLYFVLRTAGFSNVTIYPQNIWVFHPVINAVGYSAQWLLGHLWRLLFLLYGRHTSRIFTKDIIAVAVKEA